MADGEGVAVWVAAGEHGGHAWPAQYLVSVDAGGRKGLMGGLGVVGGESDADGSARDARRRRFERDDGVVLAGGEFDPPAAVRGRVVAENGEAEGVDVEAQGGLLVVDRDADGADAGDVRWGDGHRVLLCGAGGMRSSR